MKKGFTLIELIGSITILAIIALIAFPVISNVLKKGNDDIDSYTKKVIISAANKYVNEHKDLYPKAGSAKNLCVDTLYNEGYLEDSFYKKYGTKISSGGVLVKSTNTKYNFKYTEDCQAGGGSSSTKVYAVNTNTITPNSSTLTDIGTTYSSCEATGYNVCLRHTIENNIVIESEFCFVYGNAEYCLVGGDNGAAYSTNVDTLQTAFGSSNCSEIPNSGYLCNVADPNDNSLFYNVYAAQNGEIHGYDDSNCGIAVAGTSSCGV